MTREEAVNIMSQMIKDEEGFLSDNTVEAHKMAIKALKQESCGDAISRQAVLDLVDSYSESRSNVEDVTQDIISDIVALPPVNPQPCEDVISREDTLKAMIEQLGIRNEDYLIPAEATLYKVVKNMPPVMREATQEEREGVEQYINSIAKPCEDTQSKEDIAKAFQFGVAFGFGKRYDEMDRVIEEIKKVITPQPKMDLSELKRRILMEVDGGTDDRMLKYCDVCDRISDSIDKYQAESEKCGDKISNKSLCDSCINVGCIFQSGIVRNHCDFYKSAKSEG